MKEIKGVKKNLSMNVAARRRRSEIARARYDKHLLLLFIIRHLYIREMRRFINVY